MHDVPISIPVLKPSQVPVVTPTRDPINRLSRLVQAKRTAITLVEASQRQLADAALDAFAKAERRATG